MDLVVSQRQSQWPYMLLLVQQKQVYDCYTYDLVEDKILCRFMASVQGIKMRVILNVIAQSELLESVVIS